ncbi:sodium:solute symporter [Roseivirga sp. BDSF3-8]|uniref:sodium:solute symporter family protein n=1 Tax=Roseivirga sp. BDSF3-8 TaxID=3241598 RepID=UPI00353206EB
MQLIDLLIFIAYMIGMLGVGYYFMGKNKDQDDYYVGGRKMGSLHVGLSVVATDVGGGFSIGLGGLGFTIGLAGSWMLFTGLIGAWLAAVLLIPKIKGNSAFAKFLTFPQLFGHWYGARVALLAGIISAIGYTGFTSSQILAGAKLANGTFPTMDMTTALLVMGIVAVVYTVMGGLKAVIYTDTIQWIILMAGLIFIGIPMAWVAVGGWEGITETVPAEMVSMSNLTWTDLLNWGVTIIPIWFVGMTLYQRIYATKDVKSAKKAWFYAGLFEWPIMAFMGVMLGLMSRVAAEQGLLGDFSAATMDAETGLPLLLRTILPAGILGLMMSAYFSAILSTADSCLMAASGNVMTDLIGERGMNSKHHLRYSQIATFILGGLALLLATQMTEVLGLMLYSYAFMVSGLFIPVLGALFWKKSSAAGAFWAMLIGGVTTVVLILSDIALPYKLDANIFGLTAALIVFIVISYLFPDKHNANSNNGISGTERNRHSNLSSERRDSHISV